MQVFAVAAGVVAVVGLAGLTVSQSIRANNADVRADALANAVQLATRDDARMVEVGPVQEISAPGEEHLYVMGDGVPAPPAGTVYRVWLVSDGDPTFVGEFTPEDGRSFLDDRRSTPAATTTCGSRSSRSTRRPTRRRAIEWWSASSSGAA